MNVEGLELTESILSRYCSRERRQRAEHLRTEMSRRLCLGAEILLNRSLETVGSRIPLPAAYERNEYGKPWLLPPTDLHVNWSHSGTWVLCAVSDAEVGIDLQSMEKDPGDSLLGRLLQPEERKYYDGASETRKKRLFYEYWAVKESYLKALGTGFHTPLDTFYVRMEGEGKHPGIVRRDAEEPCVCRLLEAPDRAYAAAVCVLGAQEEMAEEIPVEILRNYK